jgi:hypothetical protein
MLCSQERPMPFPIDFDATDRIFVIHIQRVIKRYDALLVTQSLSDVPEPSTLSLLLDFNELKEEFGSVVEWALFVDRIRQSKDQHIALLSSLVGHSTPCHLIALLANRENQNVRAFQSALEARSWLRESD